MEAGEASIKFRVDDPLKNRGFGFVALLAVALVAVSAGVSAGLALRGESKNSVQEIVLRLAVTGPQEIPITFKGDPIQVTGAVPIDVSVSLPAEPQRQPEAPQPQICPVPPAVKPPAKQPAAKPAPVCPPKKK